MKKIDEKLKKNKKKKQVELRFFFSSKFGYRKNGKKRRKTKTNKRRKYKRTERKGKKDIAQIPFPLHHHYHLYFPFILLNSVSFHYVCIDNVTALNEEHVKASE